MTRSRQILVAIAIAVVAGLAILILLRRGGGEADTEPNPTAVITVAPVRSAQVEDVVSAYGVVAADPAGALTVAAPKQVIVSRMLVRVGQTVGAGQPVLEVASAPGAELAYKQAMDAAAFARSDLARTQRMFDERLAANDQLETAKKNLADAEAALAAQVKQGAGRTSQTLTAPAAGVVTNVAVGNGDHVAQDAPLVTLARSGAAVAKLGLEPAGGAYAPGQAVTIRPVSGGAPVFSHLTLVGRAADPTTKMLDAVAPLNAAVLPIGAGVQGDIVTGAHPGLIAPRAAVVFDETGPHIFTVAGGKAHRVFVQVGQDHGSEIEIRGQIPANAQVAVEGAYELQDGMAVKVRGK
jgi:RND family efflux transporter MFP subunit